MDAAYVRVEDASGNWDYNLATIEPGPAHVLETELNLNW